MNSNATRGRARGFTLIALMATLLGACGGDSTAPEPSIVGTWSGALQTGTMTVTLSLNESAISGSGSLIGPSESIAMTVTGTFSRPNVSLNMVAVGYEPMNYTGTLDEDVILGRINGSGFVNVTVNLNRQ